MLLLTLPGGGWKQRVTKLAGLGIECSLGCRIGSTELEGLWEGFRTEVAEMRHEGIAKMTEVCAISFICIVKMLPALHFPETWDT